MSKADWYKSMEDKKRALQDEQSALETSAAAWASANPDKKKAEQDALAKISENTKKLGDE